MNARANNGQTPLYGAVSGRTTPAFIQLFLDAGAEINIQDNEGNTPLHRSVKRFGKPEIAAFLLEMGANPTTQNNEGQTPCDIANNKIKRSDVYEALCAEQ